jgi:Tfp pilus assembly protein PilV
MDKQRMEGTGERGGITLPRLRTMKGMTLLEVTISLFVLAVGLLGLAGLHLAAMQSDTLGQQATLASNLAKDKLAELQEAEQLIDGTDQYIDGDNGVTYTRQWIVQSDISREDMIAVQVQVSWQGSMVDRCVTMSSVIKRT